MNLLSIQNLTFSQGVKTLFKDINFGIDSGEKIALIGINGSGKTTLLSLIANLTESPHPSIVTQQGLKITYLPQLPAFDPDDTILDHLFRSDSPAANAIREYQLCLEEMEDERFARATAQMDLLQAWDYEAKVESILKELHIHHLTQKMGSLSGGMVKKISLAQVFFEETDLLILDEPTNHLDIETIDWLENRLSRMDGTLLMVTHDRYFLDKICTKILEIDQESIFTYRGNYHYYLEQKEARYLAQKKEKEDLRSILRVELEWLQRGAKARSTKQKARKDRIAEMVSKNTYSEEKVLELGVAGRRLGKKILDLRHVSKAFDGKRVIDDFSYAFKAGEKIGILGPNGAGKTSLLNIITGRLMPDGGEVDVGINTAFGYFDQHSRSFNPNHTITKHMKQFGEQITLHDGTQLSAVKLLEKFLFPAGSHSTPVGKLSGGERRRLDLVCMLLGNPNFLLFDEPTNDLDITTLSILENFLLSFAGCVIVISHDRYFMDRVVDQLLIFKGGGKIVHFWGSYTDYVDTLKDLAKFRPLRQAQGPVAEPVEATARKRLNNKEQQEFKILEHEIERLESEKAKLTDFFSSATGTPEEYEKAGKRLAEISKQLEQKFGRWEELGEFT